MNLFFITFFVEPDEKIKTDLVQYDKDLEVHHKLAAVAYRYPNMYTNKNQEIFHVYGIFKFLVQEFQKENGMGKFTSYSSFFAISRSLLPIVYRVLAGELFNNSALDVLQMFGIVFNTLVGYWSAFLFLIFYIRDLDR